VKNWNSLLEKKSKWDKIVWRNSETIFGKEVELFHS
jgi:hypothetical protein